MSERSDQEEIRRQRRDEMIAAGVDVYPARSNRQQTIAVVLGDWVDGQSVAIAGRVRSLRLQGGSAFAHIEDESGRMQVFFQSKKLGTAFAEIIARLDLGDFIDVQGLTFMTKRGERTVDVQDVRWLGKALRPLPSAWHGLADVETRYRFRELDLLTNDAVRHVFISRGKILHAVRTFLVNHGYIEVETPMLQALAGGATARPFTTHHHALDIDLFLRVAPELYLKRLVVGGMGRVFEIGRNFRNEGIDRDHNPEFTMLECYAPFTDYEWLMDLTEDIFIAATSAIHGQAVIPIGETSVPLHKPFPRQSYRESILSRTKLDIDVLSDDDLRTKGRALGTDLPDTMSRPKMIDEIFKTHVRPTISAPAFIYDYPLELSPLAKKKFNQPAYTERFQLLVAGTELGNAFSELNDPVDQAERFAAQEALRTGGDDEAQPHDDTYIRSLEYGLPPTSGLGIGIDRLTAVILGQRALKDVILFPTLKPEQP